MAATTSAREMSRTYARYLFAQLAGDEVESLDYGIWLDAHWQETIPLPDEPCLADADGIHVPGDAVAWIEHDGAIIGLLAGRRRGCYRIPLDEQPPAIALMLDDALGCSTGSVHQERLHTQRRPADTVATPVVSLRSGVARQERPYDLPPVAPPPPPAAATELGI